MLDVHNRTLGQGSRGQTGIGSLTSANWKYEWWEEDEELDVQMMEASNTKLGVDHPDMLTDSTSTTRKPIFGSCGTCETPI